MRSKNSLLWNLWPRYYKTETAQQKIWFTKDHKYKIVESHPIGGLSVRVYALVKEETGWFFVDPTRHWFLSRQAAKRACERHWRRQNETGLR